MTPERLAHIAAEWLNVCGPCDGGLPMGCACSDADPRPVIAELLTELDDMETRPGVVERIKELKRDGFWCCEVGCGDGGCEHCPCCDAGWCVSGSDGIPDEPEQRANWLEIAAEHNPLVPLLIAAWAERGES